MQQAPEMAEVDDFGDLQLGAELLEFLNSSYTEAHDGLLKARQRANQDIQYCWRVARTAAQEKRSLADFLQASGAAGLTKTARQERRRAASEHCLAHDLAGALHGGNIWIDHPELAVEHAVLNNDGAAGPQQPRHSAQCGDRIGLVQ